MSFDSIHQLAKDYVDTRKRHIDTHWLNLGKSLRRIWNPYSGILKALWEADITSSKDALDTFRTGLRSSQVPHDDLKDYIIHLKTHNFRVSDRNHFLILYPAFAATLVVFVEAGGFGKLFSIIPAVLGAFIITERAALHTQKVVNDELVSILEREMERFESTTRH